VSDASRVMLKFARGLYKCFKGHLHRHF